MGSSGKYDAGATSSRQGREGGAARAICHHHYGEWAFPASACQGDRAGGQRVSSLNVLVNGGSTIQRLVPTFIFDAQGKNLVPCDSPPARSVETTFLSVQKPQLLNCCSALGSKYSLFTSKRFLPLAFHSLWSSLK